MINYNQYILFNSSLHLINIPSNYSNGYFIQLFGYYWMIIWKVNLNNCVQYETVVIDYWI